MELRKMDTFFRMLSSIGEPENKLAFAEAYRSGYEGCGLKVDEEINKEINRLQIAVNN